jgi:hypothetical protein
MMLKVVQVSSLERRVLQFFLLTSCNLYYHVMVKSLITIHWSPTAKRGMIPVNRSSHYVEYICLTMSVTKGLWSQVFLVFFCWESSQVFLVNTAALQLQVSNSWIVGQSPGSPGPFCYNLHSPDVSAFGSKTFSPTSASDGGATEPVRYKKRSGCAA